MKTPTWNFIFILVITLTLIILYSFSKTPLKIAGIEVRQPELKDILSADTLPKEALAAINIDTVKQAPPKTDTTAQRILLIGDSMLEGLMHRLKDYAEENGHEIQPVIWYSSQSEWFGKYDTLKYFINQYKPTYVILVLGANELFVPNIKSKRDKYVKRILSQIDTLRYVWVGPPNWKDDTGINDLILRNVGEKRYFPSKNLKYNRHRDGAHPTRESAAMWMDSISSWIASKSMYPIKLKKPSHKYNKYPRPILVQPLKS